MFEGERVEAVAPCIAVNANVPLSPCLDPRVIRTPSAESNRSAEICTLLMPRWVFKALTFPLGKISVDVGGGEFKASCTRIKKITYEVGQHARVSG